MDRFSDVHDTILQLLAECGWVSQSVLELIGYSYTYRTRSLKTLLDQQYIRKQGKGKSKSYALAVKGRNYLAGFYASRFREEALTAAKQLSRHPERAVLRGDAAAMLSFAGFSIHMDDKPPLPAYTPPLPETPNQGDWKKLFQNIRTYSYQDETDGKSHERRLSPIGCYYDATVIKELAGSSGWDAAGIGYSRACGVLMTPSYLFRVYHSREVAMKFQVTGEKNFRNLLLTDRIFTGYLPQADDAALIFGTDFTAAEHILRGNLEGNGAQLPIYVKSEGQKGYHAVKGTKGEMLTPGNLGNPAFYLPLCGESLSILRLMHYPFWQDTLIREINRELFHMENNSRWCFELDGCVVYILVCLNLPQFGLALQTIRTAADKKVRIICLDWQEPLFRQLLESIAHSRDIRITRLPAVYIEEIQKQLERYWEG